MSAACHPLHLYSRRRHSATASSIRSRQADKDCYFCVFTWICHFRHFPMILLCELRQVSIPHSILSSITFWLPSFHHHRHPRLKYLIGNANWLCQDKWCTSIWEAINLRPRIHRLRCWFSSKRRLAVPFLEIRFSLSALPTNQPSLSAISLSSAPPTKTTSNHCIPVEWKMTEISLAKIPSPPSVTLHLYPSQHHRQPAQQFLMQFSSVCHHSSSSHSAKSGSSPSPGSSSYFHHKTQSGSLFLFFLSLSISLSLIANVNVADPSRFVFEPLFHHIH